MHALLVIAHGSRRASSNTEVIELAKKLSRKVEGKYDIIEAGFLEMAEPDIAMSMQACIDKGATRIDVLPYFLAAGKHVVTDVPEDVAKVVAGRPDIDVNILPYVGSVPTMLDLMAGICLGDRPS